MLQNNTLAISPNNPKHSRLEQSFIAFLSDRGFMVDELTYHSRLSKDMADVLKGRYDPTALYLRGRADRIAVHPKLPIEFEWEAKTHESKKYHDLTVEALPLAHHIEKSKHDVKCLYVFTDAEGRNRCFFVDQLPAVKVIMIPDRWSVKQTAWFKEHLAISFPGVNIVTGIRSFGSGDPFVVIDQKTVNQLPDWHGVIDSLFDEPPAPLSERVASESRRVDEWLGNDEYPF